MWLRPAVCRLLAALPHLPRRFRGGAPFEVPNGCWRFVRKGREWGLRRFAAYPYFGGRPWRPLDHSGWRSAAKISAMHKAYVWPWPCHVCVRDRCRRQRCVGSRQGRCRGRCCNMSAGAAIVFEAGRWAVGGSLPGWWWGDGGPTLPGRQPTFLGGGQSCRGGRGPTLLGRGQPCRGDGEPILPG